MKVWMAYLGVIAIWSTTPLGIKWSTEGSSFLSALAARVSIATLLALVVLCLVRKPLIRHRGDCWGILAGVVGAIPNIFLVFWAAQYIASGMIAMIFGFYPFFIGIFSLWILKENMFTPMRVFGLILAFLSLALIQYDKIRIDQQAYLGLLGALGATLCFALSSVLVKRVAVAMSPLQHAAGVLLVSMPISVGAWWFFEGGNVPEFSLRAGLSVLYLAVFGSVIGGSMFFYVVAKCEVASVALITLITPFLGALLGVLMNNEALTPLTSLGAMLLLVALALYQNIWPALHRASKLLIAKLRIHPHPPAADSGSSASLRRRRWI